MPSSCFARRFAFGAATLLLAATAQAACDNAHHQRCADLGPFTATALRAQVAEKAFNFNTGSRAVRTVVRLRNTSAEPLILACKGGSLHLSDDLGLDYSAGGDHVTAAKCWATVQPGRPLRICSGTAKGATICSTVVVSAAAAAGHRPKARPTAARAASAALQAARS